MIGSDSGRHVDMIWVVVEALDSLRYSQQRLKLLGSGMQFFLEGHKVNSEEGGHCGDHNCVRFLAIKLPI